MIERCYWPLLELAESHDIPIGIELTAYTLEIIQRLSPAWVKQFAKLLRENKCELLASGDSQIIGPLVPATVNNHNIRLGLISYEKYLGIRPKLAYINEQAVSPGLLDIYIDHAFDAVVVEWDNPFAFNPGWSETLLHRPQRLAANSGRSIPVIWNNAISFQKFQRFAHGELTQNDYLEFLTKSCSKDCAAFSVYGNDAEIFDFRPGRFKEEHKHETHEWQKIQDLFVHLNSEKHYQWVMPNALLSEISSEDPLHIFSAEHAISVKKQAKYNITRWAISGRNDLALNTYAHQQYQQLLKAKDTSDQKWRNLCRLWASDLRTHLTEDRYKALSQHFSSQYFNNHGEKFIPGDQPLPDAKETEYGQFKLSRQLERQRVSIKSPFVHITFNIRRGLTIESLAFTEHKFKPIFGTLAHGYFNHIRYAADFYSNHLVMERFRERDRVTDLNPAHVFIRCDNDIFHIIGKVNTPYGDIIKHYQITGSSITCKFTFSETIRPEASLRLGFLTFLDTDSRFWYACHNGGTALEKHEVDVDFDHGLPVSSIVSASSALGATEGEIILGNGQRSARVSWDPASCAALPMLSSKTIHQQYLNRFWFSLVECDETLKPGGQLLPFEFSISPKPSI